MATLQAFDTLGYTKALVAKGYDRAHAEAWEEAQQEFFAKDVATETFVQAEIGKAVEKLENKIEQEVSKLENKIELEISLLENRLTKTFGKTMMACTGLLLAGIPIIQALLQRIG